MGKKYEISYRTKKVKKTENNKIYKIIIYSKYQISHEMEVFSEINTLFSPNTVGDS